MLQHKLLARVIMLQHKLLAHVIMLQHKLLAHVIMLQHKLRAHASTLLILAQISSRYKSRTCAHSYLQIATSSFLLLWKVPRDERCIHVL